MSKSPANSLQQTRIVVKLKEVIVAVIVNFLDYFQMQMSKPTGIRFISVLYQFNFQGRTVNCVVNHP